MHSQIGPVIVDLIEELEIQLDQEFYSYYKMDNPKEPLPMLEPPAVSTMAGAESMSVETSTKTPAGATSQNIKIPNSPQVNFHFSKKFSHFLV